VSAAVVFQARPLSSFSHRIPPSLSALTGGSAPKPVRKKKVAIILGYDGRPFHGNQFTTDPGCLAVENVLFEALWRAGAMKDETHQQNKPSKISLTRSSRTDKGVHAARIVFGAKVMLDMTEDAAADKPEAEGAPSAEGLKHRLNQHLPEAVRCWGVVPIRGGFNARRECHWREYVYVMPLAAMNVEQGGAAAALARMDECLKLFEGTHGFHHYTPWKSFGIKDARQRVLAIKGNRNRYADDLELENFIAADPDLDEEEYAAAKEWFQGLDRHFNERPASQDFISTIYKCEREGDVFYTSVGGQEIPAVSVRICGQRFVYNQIRMMMGAVMGVVAGYYPLEAVHSSLLAEKALAMPLAPAEGLFLHSSGFELNDPPMYLNREIQKLYHDTFGPVEDEVVFIDEGDWQRSVDFEAVLRRATVEEWYASYYLRETTAQYLLNGTEDAGAEAVAPEGDRKIETNLCRVWQATLQKYRDGITGDVVETIKELSAQLTTQQQARAVEAHQRLVARRKEQRAFLQANDEAWERFRSQMLSLRRRRARQVGNGGLPDPPELLPLEKVLDYRSVTPRRMNSVLAQHFRLPPGRYCQDVQLALAVRLLSGEIDEHASIDDLVKVVESDGLVEMALEGAHAEAIARKRHVGRKNLLEQHRQVRETSALKS